MNGTQIREKKDRIKRKREGGGIGYYFTELFSILLKRRCVFFHLFLRFGIRFPCMSDAYSKDLRKLVVDITAELGYSNFVREGVYCMVSGPNFETIAEARMLHILGSDSVGMDNHNTQGRKKENCLLNRSYLKLKFY